MEKIILGFIICLALATIIFAFLNNSWSKWAILGCCAIIISILSWEIAEFDKLYN